MRPERRFEQFFLLALLGFSLLLSSGQTQAGPPLPIDPTDFGLVFVNSAEEARGTARIQRAVSAGARMDRFPLYWNNIEIQRGRFEWSRHDAAIRANEAQGLETLALLLSTSAYYYPSTHPAPNVGSGRPASSIAEPLPSLPDRQPCAEGMRPPGALNEPIFADGTDRPAPGKGINPANPWARFVEEAVNRYRPGGSAGLNVRHWEIWNEPDLCHFWSSTPRQYARLLKVAYLVIKQADPQATVIWGGLAHYGNRDFLEGLVQALREDPMAATYNGFFDAAASHQYSDVTQGQVYTQRVRRALTGTGWENKAVWITESGVPVCGDAIGPPCPDAHRANSEGQAAYIWQNVAYTRLANGGPIFHFQLHDDCGNEARSAPPADAFGLVSNEGDHPCVPHRAQPRLAYSAYQLAARYFPQTQVLWDDTQEGVRRVAFYHPATRERRILVWMTGDSSGIARVPATAAQGRRIGVDGSYQDMTPVNGEYQIPLPGSTNMRRSGSATYIGGLPYLLIERDAQPPTTTLALKTLSELEFEVTWQASDLGSGLLDVSLWMQIDDGKWQRWLGDLPAEGDTAAEGTAGHRYRFALLATDGAGNALTTPIAQAELSLGAKPRQLPNRLYLPLMDR
ncbi:MAG: hypothetical protein H0T73_02110 [Ardenticatenales bacterium]|nr:hypothetical protein [Ardenticatenales bacterium]